MVNAASAYSSSVRRFRDDAGMQGAHYTFNAACEGAKVIAASLQCTHAVVVGISLAQSASAAEAIEAVLWEAEKRCHVEVAWKAYQHALNHPGSRKAGLKAMRRNPTLAKYAIAWGAVIEKDALVTDFMSYCGVNADTLSGNARIDKVVEYLEARMPDDIQVVDRAGPTEGAEWNGNVTVELTAERWIEAKTLGETQGGVHSVDTSKIEIGLAAYEAAEEELTRVQDDRKRKYKVQTAIHSLKETKEALEGYSPMGEKGLVEEMKEIQEQFISQMDIEMKCLEWELEKIKERLAEAGSRRSPR